MSHKCPVFIDNNCLIKENFSKNLISKILNLNITQNYETNCNGVIENCSFKSVETIKEEISEEPKVEIVEEQKQEITNTKISIHICENPYLVKSDILVYPANILLTIDDFELNRMSRGKIQNELDKISKPIKMGTVYITSNGNEGTNVKPNKIYHAVVAGESRLVNEADVKSAIRKSLHLANNEKAKNIVMIPPDCGTHDINDIARVHLSAIKTFLQTEKCELKNIFIVMSDKESYDSYSQYYKRIFK